MESLNPAKGIHLGGSIVAIGASAIGIVTEAFGCRLFRVTLFMIGFAFGGTGIAMLAKQVFTADEWVVTASWVAFVVGGVLAASSSCIWQHSASLLTVAGVMLVVLNDAFGYMIYPSHHDVILALLCMMFGLLGGILALKLENPVLIVAPSLFRSGILVWGIGYFAGDFPNFTDLKDIATKRIERRAWCAYLAGFAVLFVLIMCIQFCSTSRDGYYHKHNASHHRTAPRRALMVQYYFLVPFTCCNCMARRSCSELHATDAGSLQLGDDGFRRDSVATHRIDVLLAARTRSKNLAHCRIARGPSLAQLDEAGFDLCRSINSLVQCFYETDIYLV